MGLLLNIAIAKHTGFFKGRKGVGLELTISLRNLEMDVTRPPARELRPFKCKKRKRSGSNFVRLIDRFKAPPGLSP